MTETNSVTRESTPHNTKRSWLMLMVGLVAGLLVGLSLYPYIMPDTAVSAAAEAPAEAGENDQPVQKTVSRQGIMEVVVANARHFNGDPDAPITLVEFADFNCGYCGKWAKETLPRIQEEYIDTGKVRMAYINYPVLGANSVTAAQATECAALQDSFWEYHDVLYQNQGIGYTPESLASLAEETGMDRSSFEQCLADFPEQAALDNDILLGQTLGIRGTPNFLINGTPITGAFPFEGFQQAIESALASEL